MDMERVWYPIIEHDMNRGDRVFDVVTKTHADDIKVGDRIIIVCSDREGHHLDWGWATWGRVTTIQPTDQDPSLVLIEADFEDAYAGIE